MAFIVRGLATDYAEAIQAGGVDANGMQAVMAVARGAANPCRHCLGLIADGEQKLVFAHRPFDRIHAYAELGPVYLHAAKCERYQANKLPDWFVYLQPAIIRGYGHDDCIVYETGDVVPGDQLANACDAILAKSEVAYVHIRSKYNCFQCRVDRM